MKSYNKINLFRDEYNNRFNSDNIKIIILCINFNLQIILKKLKKNENVCKILKYLSIFFL